MSEDPSRTRTVRPPLDTWLALRVPAANLVHWRRYAKENKQSLSAVIRDALDQAAAGPISLSGGIFDDQSDSFIAEFYGPALGRIAKLTRRCGETLVVRVSKVDKLRWQYVARRERCSLSKVVRRAVDRLVGC